MPSREITLTTRDGQCPVQLLTPSGEGPWPGIIFYSDAGGIRPAMVEMAQRLANAGYAVLLPDLFYRYGRYIPLVPVDVFKGDVMAVLGPLMATTDNEKAASDTTAFINYLDKCQEVASLRFRAVGFCMGGGMALYTAGALASRFAAVASFHGGNLATESVSSPHLLASQIQSDVYVAGAENDESCPPEMTQLLEQALRSGDVTYISETYAGALHGWMVPDFPTFNAALAEEGWNSMLALFFRTLISR